MNNAGQRPATSRPSASFAERRRHLGYRSARLLAAGPLGAEGARFRGHEFHYATILEEKGSALFSVADASENKALPFSALFSVADASGNELGRAGLRRGKVFGSFIHLVDSAD